MADSMGFALASLLDWLLKGFLILGFTFLVDQLLRRANASLRHLVWVVGLLSVILIPFITPFVPALNFPLFRLSFLSRNMAQELPPIGKGDGSVVGISGPETLLGGYMAGVLVVLGWQLVGRFYTFRLRKQSSKVTDSRLQNELQRIKTAMGIQSHVELLSSSLVPIPFSIGLLQPAIIFPETKDGWPPSVLESVLVHELAHIKRKDCLARIAAQIGCCIHWINPLAWYGLGRMIMEQEIACDNLVLGSGAKASEYAGNLLALTKVRPGRFEFVMTTMSRQAELKNRLMEILNPTRSRSPLRIGVFLFFIAAMLGLLLPVSALNIWESYDKEIPIKTMIVARPGNPVSGKADDCCPGDSQASNRSMDASATQAKLAKETEILKKEITKKLQQLKAQGAPQSKIDEFTAAAKAKLLDLQKKMQAAKQTDPVSISRK